MDDEEGPGSRWVSPRVRAGALLGRRDWDAIVIGGGLGGLSCAALLASHGAMRVLVLERHYALGGLAQSFRRRRYAFDVGVHYVGEMGQGAMLRRIMDAVGAGRIEWAPLPPRYERFVLDGREILLGGPASAWRAQLAEACPGQERAIDFFLGEVEACARAAPVHLLSRMRAGAIDAARDRAPFYRWADRTTREVLEQSGASPLLASLLGYLWCNYACPPDRSSFAAHAITMAHYFGGAFYPVGGGGVLGPRIARAITERGGAVVVRAEVERILVEGDRTRGVRLATGEEVRSEVVVSDAGAATTFERLLGDEAPRVGELRERVRAIGPSSAHVGLYLGIARTPAELGLDGANAWLGGAEDLLGAYPSAGAWARAERAEPPLLFASSACANDPSFAARYPGRSVLTATVAVPYEAFEAHRDTARGRRGAAYEACKEALGRGMLAVLERRIPALRGAIEHLEVSTPLSTRDYAGHAHGEGCGLAPTPQRFRLGPLPATPVAGLFLAGQDVWACGVGGAVFGGLLAASAVLRRDLVLELASRSG